MKKYRGTGFILFIISIGILSFFIDKAIFKRECPGQEKKIDTIVYYRAVHDTVIKEIPSPLPYPVYITDTFFKHVDTLAIIARFLKVYHYSDTISDSSIVAIVNDDIFQNMIIKRDFKYSLLQEKVIEVKKEIYKPSKGLYIGAFAGTLGESANIGASGLYVFKNHAISLNIGIDKSISAGYYWKIWK